MDNNIPVIQNEKFDKNFVGKLYEIISEYKF